MNQGEGGTFSHRLQHTLTPLTVESPPGGQRQMEVCLSDWTSTTAQSEGSGPGPGQPPLDPRSTRAKVQMVLLTHLTTRV